MEKVDIYADGACEPNPGIGGWACILIHNGVEKEISGYEPNTTNNIMELTAVIEGLKALRQVCEVDVYTDSAYIVNCFNEGWIHRWKLTKWKNANNKPVKNKELWQELCMLMKIYKVNFIKVEAHSDNEYNNRCDELARYEIKNYIKIGDNYYED